MSYLSVLVGVLEGLHQPESLVHRSAHGKVIHGDLAEDAAVVDDEQAPEEKEHDRVKSRSGGECTTVFLLPAPERMSIVLQVDPVVLGDGMSEVGEERDVQPAEAALLARGVHPRQVSEVGVHRTGHHLKSSETTGSTQMMSAKVDFPQN